MPLNSTIRDLWCRFQGELFPGLANGVGPLSKRHRRFVAVLDAVPVEPYVAGLCRVWRGRPPEDRMALARAFVAKAVWDLPTTRGLIDRIEADPKLRRLCGWSRCSQVPSESTFSRAFGEFAETDLPGRMHRVLVEDAYRDTIIGHISRDSTAIEARERPAPKPKAEAKPKRRRGRPPKGEERPKDPTRLERQLAGMGTGEMVAGPAVGLRHRRQAQRQGPLGLVDRLQAAHRRGRRRHPCQLPPDIRVCARQPGGDPAGGDEPRAGRPSLRADGQRLRFGRD